MEHQRASEGVKGDEIAKREPLRGEEGNEINIVLATAEWRERAIGIHTFPPSCVWLSRMDDTSLGLYSHSKAIWAEIRAWSGAEMALEARPHAHGLLPFQKMEKKRCERPIPMSEIRKTSQTPDYRVESRPSRPSPPHVS